MWVQQTLLSPTNGDGKRESVEDRSNELEACQSVCVSVSWRSPRTRAHRICDKTTRYKYQ